MKNQKDITRSAMAAQRGFTLIELSIVLVIIGLITGAILGGAELIHAAKLRSLISDRDKYIVAVMAFKSKYDCLPGDCSNAEDFFGSMGSCPVGNWPWNTLTTNTCNGNGDSKITDSYSSGWAGVQQQAEFLRVWQQLAAANLITGQFIGNGENNVPAALGAPNHKHETLPATKLNNVYASIHWLNPDVPEVAGAFPGQYTHVVSFGDMNLTSGTYCANAYCGSLSTMDSYSIDAKTDDGRPGTGSTVTFRWGYENACVTSNDAETSEYDISYSDPRACIIIFRNAF